MANHILKLRELNRATLARQMLLEREALSVPTAIERLVGLQAQLAPAPYVGLWTRLRDFKREDLADQIENRKVVKATFIRATLHLVTAEDYLRFRTALQPLLIGAAVWAFRQQLRLATTNRALEKTNVDLTETRLRLANETETERSRIARDLHDQTLADLRHLLVMTDQLPNSNGEESAPTPAVLRREIESISSEIRHICEDLSPSALENIGFLPALDSALSNSVAQLPAEEKFAYEFVCEPNLEERLRLSHIEQIQLYRMVQEALNNICRHARARQVKISARAENSTDLLIEVRDDGVGFDRAGINRTGHGIANIRSRANLIGARVEWSNARPGCRFEIRKRECVGMRNAECGMRNEEHGLRD